jgi:uncharacterized damage-inducible protein DinB
LHPDSGISLLLKKEAERRIIQESVPRIKKCLSLLTADQIWYKANSNSNAIGNLVLHICGNARQWICSGIGDLPDARNRQIEFTSTEPLNADTLSSLLDTLCTDVSEVIEHIRDDEWTKIKKVQVFEETVLSILVHVIEHFSYHTGQITYLTKLLTDRDLKYYGDLNLEIHHE